MTDTQLMTLVVTLVAILVAGFRMLAGWERRLEKLERELKGKE